MSEQTIILQCRDNVGVAEMAIQKGDTISFRRNGLWCLVKVRDFGTVPMIREDGTAFYSGWIAARTPPSKRTPLGKEYYFEREQLNSLRWVVRPQAEPVPTPIVDIGPPDEGVQPVVVNDNVGPRPADDASFGDVMVWYLDATAQYLTDELYAHHQVGCDIISPEFLAWQAEQRESAASAMMCRGGSSPARLT